jgi:eukaryotic-like serine/threonine-protein kinase
MNARLCPDDALLGAFVDGALAASTRAQVVSHVDTCPRCRVKVSEWLSRVPPAETKASAVPELPGEGATIAGRYRLGRMLGRGGMGVVYDAIQLDLGRPVAVKLLPPTADDVASSRFAREARTLAQLAHPNIVQIFDYGTDMATAYVVMERLEGRTLSAALRTEGPFDAARAVRITSEILRALAVTHRAGIVHRDIKPANVFLHSGDSVKLLDFGIASTSDGSPRLTMTGMTLGTPAYMAPEQVLAGTVDGRTDLYAVGVCLFEMLTGRRPFHAATSTQVLALIIQGGPPRADAVRPDIPARLADAIARAMARDPAARFPDAAAFSEAIGSLPPGVGALQPPHPSFAPAAPPSFAPQTYAASAQPTVTSTGYVAPTRDMTAPMPPGLHVGSPSVAPATPGRSWLAPVLGLIAVLLLGVVAVGAYVGYQLTTANGNAGGSANLPDASARVDGAAPPPRASSSGLVAPAPQGKVSGRPGGAVPAASAAATSPNCSCVNEAGGVICVAPRIPECDCREDGKMVCPQPWNAAGRCAVGTGNGTNAYDGAGRNSGDSCTGFKLLSVRPSDGGASTLASSTTQVSGKLHCMFCRGLGDRFAGVNGARCRGTNSASETANDLFDGTVVCK